MPELTINPGVELRNAEFELHQFRVRLAIASGFVLFLFALLAGRFFYLQVVRHGELQTLAEANRISIVPVVPNRGIIVDRNGVVLAHNYSAYTLEIQPARVENLDADPSDPKSADGVLHNPHTYNVYGASSRTIFNKPLPTKGQVINYKFKKLDLKKSPIVFLQCDQHNFMEAWFHSVKNPYYAVVGKDGTFTIDGIPPGEYELYAWHPMMAEAKEQKIKIAPNGKASVNFEFTTSDVKIKSIEPKKDEKGDQAG